MHAMTSMLASIDRSQADGCDVVLTGAKLVKEPEDMALLLLRASPQQAASFALAAHERAAWAQDDDRTGFWLEVIALLASPQSGCLSKGNRS